MKSILTNGTCGIEVTLAPETAKQNRACWSQNPLSCPFRASVSIAFRTQGGAARLSPLRSALIAVSSPAGLSTLGCSAGRKPGAVPRCGKRPAPRGLPWAGVFRRGGVDARIFSTKTRSASRRMACPIARRLSPDFRARRCALAADEYSDDDDVRLTIRASQGRGQRVVVGSSLSILKGTCDDARN